jgi:hypothetical protein
MLPIKLLLIHRILRAMHTGVGIFETTFREAGGWVGEFDPGGLFGGGGRGWLAGRRREERGRQGADVVGTGVAAFCGYGRNLGCE